MGGSPAPDLISMDPLRSASLSSSSSICYGGVGRGGRRSGGGPATARHTADVQRALLDAARQGHIRQMRLLIEAGADVDAMDTITGETPMIACMGRRMAVRDGATSSDSNGSQVAKLVHILLDAGADTDASDRLGRSALMHAALSGQVDVVQLLLDQPNVDLELQDNEGNTALMHAARHGHADIVSMILQQMGRLRQILHLSQHNRQGLTAMELARHHGHWRVAAALGCAGTAERHTSAWPTFPLRPPRADQADDNDGGFPHPSQLERGPTPGSPLLSFPVRWQQRKLEKEQRRLQHQEEATKGKALDGKQVPSASNRYSLPLLGCRASAANEQTSDPLPCHANDNFHRVLNLLDASIQEAEISEEVDPLLVRSQTMQDTSGKCFPPPSVLHLRSAAAATTRLPSTRRISLVGWRPLGAGNIPRRATKKF